jgi:hypothetical protein
MKEQDAQQSNVMLWLGLLAGPWAWACSQQVSYLFVTLRCSHAKSLSIGPLMLGTMLLAVMGIFVSWRNWQRAGSEWPDEGGGRISRSRFMAVTGLLLSSFSLLVILAEWLPAFFYRHCER